MKTMTYVLAIALATTFLPAIAVAQSAGSGDVYKNIAKNAQPGTDLTQSVYLIAMTVQMMPPEDRQKFIMESAKGIQDTPQKQRASALSTIAVLLKGMPEDKRQAMMGYVMQSLQVMSAVEKEIVAVQMQKLVGDIRTLPQDQQTAILPPFNQVIHAASGQ